MRVILVTGSPRSGTTAVGRNLALAPTAGSLYEPFNVQAGLKDIRHQFEIVGANDFTAAKLAAIVDGIARLRLPHWKAPVRPTDNVVRRLLKHGVGGLGRQSYLKCRLNPFLKTLVWKDPLAAFVAHDVAHRYGMPVLVTVRPPVAVVASFKRMNWKPDANAILDAFAQVGWDDRGLRRNFGSRFHEPTVAAAAMWWLVYSRLVDWASGCANIRFVSVEDLVKDPAGTYRALYAKFELPWSSRIEKSLRSEYSQECGAETNLPAKPHVKKRSIKDINVYGSSLLSGSEKEIIREMTDGLWQRMKYDILRREPAASSDERFSTYPSPSGAYST
jgi:sulfotransferase family protein